MALAACLAVFERLVAKAAFTTVFAESATAFIVVETTFAVAMETAAFFAASVRSCSRCGALGWFVGHHAEAGVVAADGHFGQDVENVLRECVREFNGTKLVKELDAADVAAVDVRFAGDCTHDVARGHMVDAANAEVIAQEAFFDAVQAFLAFLTHALLFFAVEAEIFAIAEEVSAAADFFATFLRGFERREVREKRLLFLVHLDDGGSDVFCGHFVDGTVFESDSVLHVAAFCGECADEFLELV